MSASDLVLLHPSHLPAVLSALGEDPVPNVFLLYLARQTGLRASSSGVSFFGHRDADGRLIGVGAFGSTLLAWAPDPETATRLGAEAISRRGQWKALLGDRRSIDPLWRAAAPCVGPPREDRYEIWLSLTPEQYQYTAAAAACPLPSSAAPSQAVPPQAAPTGPCLAPARALPAPYVLRPAVEGDLPRVLPLRCAMYEEPEGRILASHERERLRRRCRESSRNGTLFLVERGARVVFTAAFSAETPEVTQISSVYTVPDERGRGIATAALAGLCARALEKSRRVSLFVAQDNAPARHVYEKLGFQPVTTARSIRLDDAV